MSATDGVHGEEGARRRERLRRLEAGAVQLEGALACPRRRSGARTRTAARGGRPGWRSSRWSRAARHPERCGRSASRAVRSPGRTPSAAPRRRDSAAPGCRGCCRGTCRRRWSLPLCRSTAVMTGSVPGARPRPRSMRPAKAASRAANCSATTSGAWLGSITPPEPTRIRRVLAARMPISTGGFVGRDRRHVVVLGDPVAAVAELVGAPREGDGGGDGIGGGLVAAHRDEVEHGQGERLRSHPRQQPAGRRRYSAGLAGADYATPVSTVWNPKACHAARSRRSPETATTSDPVRNSADAQCTAS